MEPIYEVSRTGRSAILFAFTAAVIVAAGAAVVLVPGVAESLILVGLVALTGLVVVGVGLALLMSVLAVPLYAAKGEPCQTNMSYDIGDVRPVGEKDGPDDPPA